MKKRANIGVPDTPLLIEEADLSIAMTDADEAKGTIEPHRGHMRRGEARKALSPKDGQSNFSASANA